MWASQKNQVRKASKWSFRKRLSPSKNVTAWGNILVSLTIRCNVQIRHIDVRAKAGACALDMCWKTIKLRFRGGGVDSLPEKFRNFVSKNSWPHRFTFCVQISHPEIGSREVGETMRCFGYKKFAKCVFVAAILRPFGGGRQMFAVRSVSSCKTSSQSVPFFRSYSRKSYFVYDHNAFCI